MFTALWSWAASCPALLSAAETLALAVVTAAVACAFDTVTAAWSAGVNPASVWLIEVWVANNVLSATVNAAC